MFLGDISIVDYSILGFGGIFCLVWAFGLSLRLPARTKWIPVFFVGISGFRLVWETFTLSGFVNLYPQFFAFPIPFLYSIGPAILLYYEKISDSEKWKLSYYHFIPIALGALPLFYWYQLDNESSKKLIQSILRGNWVFPDYIFIIWILGPKFSILAYTLYVGSRKSGEGVLAIRLLPERIRIFSRLLLFYILIMILADIFGYLFGNTSLYRYSSWSHSFAAVIVYLYSRYNPDSMLEISGAIQKARYSQSKLNGINAKDAISKLNYLMASESYYADEDLRLSTLADAMEISVHQLSELINVHFQMSFIQLINSHRILIACKLIEEEERNLLSIAYSVGFNSKSAFNRVFRLLIGNSPREYRKNPSQFAKEKSEILSKINPKL